MSGRRRSSASSSQPSANKRSKKNGNVLPLLFPTTNKVHASLEESHKGKRILLDAKQQHDSSQGVILEGEDWLACLFLCQGSIGFYFMYLLFFNSY